ncbi:tannase/feruloyl esterase family alpha/beta hydrolase [Halomonas salipaludis]|uniref:Tannase/feruloyl esterase family alpha/beta hydrolase n=1 Tax=Halomonas salipaludis TaxID=2032625 RepID=A0A2A2EQ93_9GAMM|nr:tannase/feruloyl esterase family alpha/beta hydrolase [Halomonas salipaludis]PAU74828.1 tannase/feruloyl esterase family alpha/beta hydrolase [Halomonas salipaludis]
MIKRLLPTTLCLTGCLFLAAPAVADGSACDRLEGEYPERSDMRIIASESLTAASEWGIAHCRVEGIAYERTGIDGQAYAIRFELRLPDEWNHGFVHQFNGGTDGEVVPATGEILPGTPTALSRGFAVVSSDAGHDSYAQDAGLASGARFGLDPQARQDYGYGAVAKLHPLAVSLVEDFYDAEVRYTYGLGRSNGGRHAMVAAARMPEAFDGLLVGYPGFNLPKAAVQHAWDIQAFTAVEGDVRRAFSRGDLARVANAVRQSCDHLDGLEDGIVADVDACQEQFDIELLRCESGASEDCLNDAKIAALKAVHAGPHNSQGVPLYSDWPWDTGIASQNWRIWKLESPIDAWENRPIIGVMGASALAQVFITPPTEVAGDVASLEQYLLEFDFDSDAPRIHASNDTFAESAMEFMTPPGVEDPEMAEFKAAGGHMLVFHGTSDPVFSVNDTTRWYRQLDHNHEGRADEFVRFYRVPGMPHGVDGVVTADVDFLSVLTAWVEEGERPDAILAGVQADNQEALDALGDISRPLCPYPQVARYQEGDEASADSFVCE